MVHLLLAGQRSHTLQHCLPQNVQRLRYVFVVGVSSAILGVVQEWILGRWSVVSGRDEVDVV